jgi:hypothetical protein
MKDTNNEDGHDDDVQCNPGHSYSQQDVESAAAACFAELMALCMANAASSSPEPHAGIFGASLAVLADVMGFPHRHSEDFLLLLYGGSETEANNLQQGSNNPIGRFGLSDATTSPPLGVTGQSIARLFIRAQKVTLAEALHYVRRELHEAFFNDSNLTVHSPFHRYSTLALRCLALFTVGGGAVVVGGDGRSSQNEERLSRSCAQFFSHQPFRNSSAVVVGLPGLMPRAIEVARAIPVLMILLGQRSVFVAPFCAFLQERRISFISRDTWDMFVMFCRQMKSEQLACYNHLDSWPTVIDEFVAWLQGARR